MAIPAVPSLPSLDNTSSQHDSSSNATTSGNGDAFAHALNQASVQQGQQDSTESAHTHSTDESQQSKPDSNQSKPAADVTSAKGPKGSKSNSKSKATDKDATNAAADQSTPATNATTSPNAVVAPVIVPDAPLLTLPTTAADATATAAAAVAQATETPVPTTTTAAASGTTPTGTTIDIVLTDPATASAPAIPTTPAAQPINGPDQLNATAGTAIALPDQTAFTQALSQVVTQQAASQTSSLGTDAKAIANGIKSTTTPAATDAVGKAAQDFATSLQTNIASTAIADTAAKDVTAPAPSAPLTQLVSVVQPLRAQGNGDYQMTLQLHPETLGKVEVSVSLHDGQISMQLSSDNAGARQMLRESMDDLRQQLESSGLSTGSLDVSTGDSTDRQSQAGTNANTNTTSSAGDELDDAEFFSRLAGVTSVNPSDGSLDVRV